MALPCHIGNVGSGDRLPPTVSAMAAATGDIYDGFWYPIIIAAVTFFFKVLRRAVREIKL